MSRVPKKVINTTKLSDPARGRLNLDLEKDNEVQFSAVVTDVNERFPGFFDCPEKCTPYDFANCDVYSEEDGFPAVLDLSAYIGEAPERQAASGKCIFETELDRLNGKIEDSIPSTSGEPQEPETYDQIEAENIKRIKAMDPEELEKARQEIYERLDSETIEFLKKRAAAKKEKPTVSLFKQRQAQKKGTDLKVDEEKNLESDIVETNDEFVKQLEIIPDDLLGKNELNEYSRLAMDPMHMSFATQYMKSTVSLQEKNLIKIFDKLAFPPKGYTGGDELRNTARSKLPAISELYLEVFVNEQKVEEKRFARDVNPTITSAWSLVPIRRVVDTFEKRANRIVTEDDKEIVELSLLFTVLLFREQNTYFQMVHGVPSDVYCRLAELFLLGPEIFKTPTVEKCVEILLNEFIMPKALKGLLSLKMNAPICDLDAFLPFYEDLLKRFLEFSYGDSHFTLFLLIPAYANTSTSDALTVRSLLWGPVAEAVRQMTIPINEAKSLIDYFRANVVESTKQLAAGSAEQLQTLHYTQSKCLTEGIVTETRNPTLYALASEQIAAIDAEMKNH